MGWWTDLKVFLSGKKAILAAIIYGIDATGSQLGYWDQGGAREIMEQVLFGIFLRLGVAKAQGAV